jgi:hypothetical protein
MQSEKDKIGFFAGVDEELIAEKCALWGFNSKQQKML